MRAIKDKRAVDGKEADGVLKKINTTCTQCHAKYRDAP
jgi:hypothetical protein